MSKQHEILGDWERPLCKVVKQPAEGTKREKTRELTSWRTFCSYFCNFKIQHWWCLSKSIKVNTFIHFKFLYMPITNKLNKNILCLFPYNILPIQIWENDIRFILICLFCIILLNHFACLSSKNPCGDGTKPTLSHPLRGPQLWIHVLDV